MKKQIILDSNCKKKLLALVRKHLGIVVFPHQMEHFNSTIKEACQRLNLHSCQAYLSLLHTDKEISDEFAHLIPQLTVGESYFFRDREQFD
ncbi:hypothetical protein ACQZV8_17815, partial [Magnetococcales bacterium HHB-1]